VAFRAFWCSSVSYGSWARGKRIIILCEGDTEELAVRYFIFRQWVHEGRNAIGLHPINLRGRLQDVPLKAAMFLDEPDVLGVFTLIDLYGMDRVAHHNDDDLRAKIERVCGWLRSGLQHPRSSVFFPYLSVHDTEALILAEGIALGRRLADTSIRPDANAELKNLAKPPQRLIHDLFVSRKGDRYHKIKDGRPLFASLQFEPVYTTCLHFREFYDALRRTAS